MDVFSSKLANRLQRAGARAVFTHTHPHAESPARRLPASSGPPGADSSDPEQQALPDERQNEGEGRERGVQDGQDPSLPSRAETSASGTGSQPNGGASANQNVTQPKDAGGGVNSADLSQTANLRSSEDETVAAGESDEFTLKPPPRRYPSGAEGQDASNLARSPSLPGPSPAGWGSPTWPFDGRLPSSGPGQSLAKATSSNAALDWRKRRMWSSGQIDEDGTQAQGVGGTTTSSHKDAGAGVNEKGHTVMTQVNSGGSTSAPTATGGSTRGSHQMRQPYETESDSDDQVAVRASAFASSAPMGNGGEVDSRPHKTGFFGGGTGAVTGSLSNRSVQWVAEMEMAFEMERRRWDE